MRALSLSMVLSVAAVAMLPGTALAQHDHAAHAHVTAPPPARPWAADTTLSTNMRQIHAALEQLHHDESGHMDVKLARDRALVIEQSAADIFAKCKLAPEQDAVLHGMLVPLLTATQKFKADPQGHDQLQAMRAAVAAYPRYFDAPGWAPESSRKR